jgi:hypothetical protein
VISSVNYPGELVVCRSNIVLGPRSAAADMAGCSDSHRLDRAVYWFVWEQHLHLTFESLSVGTKPDARREFVRE